MEAARIKPDPQNKISIAISLIVIAAMIVSLNSGYVFSQNSHEVGLTENIAGLYGTDVSKPPVEIKVYQNTPNPFTATTTIKFETNTQSSIRVVLYDKYGSLVKAYLYDNIAPGMHEVKVDGADFPAGEYTYRFVSGNYSQSYKMNLIK